MKLHQRDDGVVGEEDREGARSRELPQPHAAQRSRSLPDAQSHFLRVLPSLRSLAAAITEIKAVLEGIGW